MSSAGTLRAEARFALAGRRGAGGRGPRARRRKGPTARPLPERGSAVHSFGVAPMPHTVVIRPSACMRRRSFWTSGVFARGGPVPALVRRGPRAPRSRADDGPRGARRSTRRREPLASTSEGGVRAAFEGVRAAARPWTSTCRSGSDDHFSPPGRPTCRPVASSRRPTGAPHGWGSQSSSSSRRGRSWRGVVCLGPRGSGRGAPATGSRFGELSR